MAVASGGWREGLRERALLLQLSADAWEITCFKLIMRLRKARKQALYLFPQTIPAGASLQPLIAVLQTLRASSTHVQKRFCQGDCTDSLCYLPPSPLSLPSAAGYAENKWMPQNQGTESPGQRYFSLSVPCRENPGFSYDMSAAMNKQTLLLLHTQCFKY